MKYNFKNDVEREEEKTTFLPSEVIFSIDSKCQWVRGEYSATSQGGGRVVSGGGGGGLSRSSRVSYYC